MIVEIQGFNGRYTLSTEGDVFSNYVGRIRKVRPRISNGYLRIALQMGGRRIDPLIHRLVAETFIPNPHALPQVNHKDGDKMNNCVSNLEWCTAKHNSEHARRMGLFTPVVGSRHGHTPLTEKQVVDLRKEYALGSVSQQTIADRYGINQTCVSAIIRRVTWRHV